MPEIAEVERARTILEQILKDQTLIDVEAFDDTIVFKDTTAKDFASTLKGKKVTGVKRWGKYFWIEMDTPPHPVLHLGMTGWVVVRGVQSHYNPPKDESQWPPRFVKFILKIAEPTTKPSLKNSLIPEIWGTEVAFIDARRLGRIRLVDAEDPFTVAYYAVESDETDFRPLNELGFDPILRMPDFETFRSAVVKRKVPIKALLLDQSFSAGVGNWVADEVLYQARIHPEQYSNTLPTEALKTLHETIHIVTTTAANVLGDSSKFPEDWLFSYRWGKSSYRGKKGGKESNVLPNGEKIIHITVGGRTSAVVESRQKKIKGSDNPVEDEEKPTPRKGKKAKNEDEDKKATLKKGQKVKDDDEENLPEKTSKGAKKDVEEKGEKRKAKLEKKDEETTPKKRRISGKQGMNGDANVASTRKSSRSKAS